MNNSNPNELTKQQKSAVETKKQYVVVVAGPGSGKTRVLTERICYLIENKVATEKDILALTFSNKAATEMKKRLYDMLGSNAIHIAVSTFHSFGLRLIRRYPEVFQRSADVNLLSTSQRINRVRAILARRGIDVELAEKYLAQISAIKNGQELFAPYEQIQAVFEEYDAGLLADDAIDFDDMVRLPVEMLRKNSIISQAVTGRFGYVFVDEVQDLNRFQDEMVDYLLDDTTSLFIVGDDDQCVYEWRGAAPGYLTDKEKNKKFEVIKLEENFRSNQKIVDVSNEFIGNNSVRIVKKLFSRKKPSPQISSITEAQRFANSKEEAKFIANEIIRLLSTGLYTYKDIAILLRSSKRQALDVKEQLSFKNIPYSDQISEHSECDDFIQVLKSITSIKKKRSISTAINYPTNIMDNYLYKDLIEKFELDENISVYDAFSLFAESEAEFEDCDIFRSRFKLLNEVSKKAKTIPVSETVRLLQDAYQAEPRITEKAKKRMEPIQTVLDIALEYEKAEPETEFGILKDFTDYISLAVQDGSNTISNKNAVHLMTCHRSKGLEFPIVFIPGVQVGIFPNAYFINNNSELEAERRLFYVSLTRAIDKVYVTCYNDPFSGAGFCAKGFLAEVPSLYRKEG